jgi:hypothetical protein
VEQLGLAFKAEREMRLERESTIAGLRGEVERWSKSSGESAKRESDLAGERNLMHAQLQRLSGWLKRARSWQAAFPEFPRLIETFDEGQSYVDAGLAQRKLEP